MKIFLSALIMSLLLAGGGVCSEQIEESADTAAEIPPATGNDPEKEESDTQPGENCFDLFKADAAGHDWANAYLLAQSAFYSYPEHLDLRSKDTKEYERQFEEIFTLWGVDTFEFIYDSGPAFGTECIVLSKKEGDFVIVAFRGSESFIKGPIGALKDSFLTDANARLEDVSEYLGDGVQVHAGFWNAFFPVRDAVAAAIERQGGFGPDKKLWITGNSLGAALATICSVWLRIDGHEVQGVYTFGSPRCGNDQFRELHDEVLLISCQRWVNDNDIVPTLPPTALFSGYRHVGVRNHIKEDGSIVFKDEGEEVIGNPMDHYLENYLHRIYAVLPPEIKVRMPVPPPLPVLVKPFQ